MNFDIILCATPFYRCCHRRMIRYALAATRVAQRYISELSLSHQKVEWSLFCSTFKRDRTMRHNTSVKLCEKVEEGQQWQRISVECFFFPSISTITQFTWSMTLFLVAFGAMVRRFIDCRVDFDCVDKLWWVDEDEKPTWEWNRYEDAIERKSTHNWRRWRFCCE